LDNDGKIFDVSLLICTATAFESAMLRKHLDRARVIETGVGPVNAAHAVTLAITQKKPAAIIVCGVGGAYSASGLQIGDVVSASVEIYGDLGANSPSGFLDMKALGFPIVAEPTPLFNAIPLQLFPTEQRVPFVTVSTCTGTEAAAVALHSRTGGAVENMEGAAIAHVAHMHGVPIGELRGVSNLVTDRDTTKWKLKEAAAAAQEALLRWLNDNPL
jgi:futalosine hydrolase